MEQAMMLLAGLGVPAGLVAALAWFHLIERLRLQELVRALAERQQPLTAEMVRTLAGRGFSAPPRERDRRRGVMLASIGVALAVLGLLAFIGLWSSGVDVAVAVGVILAGVGAIPGCVGAGYVILSRDEREDGDD